MTVLGRFPRQGPLDDCLTAAVVGLFGLFCALSTGGAIVELLVFMVLTMVVIKACKLAGRGLARWVAAQSSLWAQPSVTRQASENADKVRCDKCRHASTPLRPHCCRRVTLAAAFCRCVVAVCRADVAACGPRLHGRARVRSPKEGRLCLLKGAELVMPACLPLVRPLGVLLCPGSIQIIFN
jgi:hypothetical protein